jgi:hypothetical protein
MLAIDVTVTVLVTELVAIAVDVYVVMRFPDSLFSYLW